MAIPTVVEGKHEAVKQAEKAEKGCNDRKLLKKRRRGKQKAMWKSYNTNEESAKKILYHRGTTSKLRKWKKALAAPEEEEAAICKGGCNAAAASISLETQKKWRENEDSSAWKWKYQLSKPMKRNTKEETAKSAERKLTSRSREKAASETCCVERRGRSRQRGAEKNRGWRGLYVPVSVWRPAHVYLEKAHDLFSAIV